MRFDFTGLAGFALGTVGIEESGFGRDIGADSGSRTRGLLFHREAL
jgi:hypothetical protein